MKIIFDSEEQKKEFMNEMFDYCPGSFGLEEIGCSGISCMECWKNVIEFEVKNDEQRTDG